MNTLKEFLKNNKLTCRMFEMAKCVKNYISDFVHDLLAIRNFMMERKIVRKNEKVRVVFLMQFPAVWNKFSSIYEMMQKKDAFEPILVCVPDGLENGKMKNLDDLTNATYDYFVDRGYNAINAVEGKDKWFNLKELKPDYVFFSRPYNHYMPKEYWSSKISKYTKICSILYAINMTVETRGVVINKNFYRNVYCYFAESKAAQQHNINNFKLAHRLGLQKTLFYGMPALEKMVSSSDLKNKAWDFGKNDFRVLWTPRWTTDLKLGGSNFFTYYQWFLDFAEKRKDIDFLFRPHPLTFSNFVKEGLLTEKEIEEYQNKIKEIDNVELDFDKEYVATFWNSSVLVTDTSSLVAEYFVTGKPLVFCMSNMILEPEDHTKKILEGCYIVNNHQEMEVCLNRLASGQDDLKEKRLEIIQDVFGDTLYTATENIVKELLENK